MNISLILSISLIVYGLYKCKVSIMSTLMFIWKTISLFMPDKGRVHNSLIQWIDESSSYFFNPKFLDIINNSQTFLFLFNIRMLNSTINHIKIRFPLFTQLFNKFLMHLISIIFFSLKIFLIPIININFLKMFLKELRII